MSAFTKQFLAPAATTGNNTSAAFYTGNARETGVVALQFVVEVAGATPTITFKYQGSLDGVNWTDLSYIPANTNVAATATQTVTTTGLTLNFLDQTNANRHFPQIRLVTSANTNVTYRAEMYTIQTNVG